LHGSCPFLDPFLDPFRYRDGHDDVFPCLSLYVPELELELELERERERELELELELERELLCVYGAQNRLTCDDVFRPRVEPLSGHSAILELDWRW
jgi:hypothetical protein